MLQKLGATVEWDVVTVNLAGNNATDDDLKYLSAFPKLQTLYLHHDPITDAGVANLQRLRNLTTLDLFDTRVTDDGLKHLSEWMPHLEWLELSDTKRHGRLPRALEGPEEPPAAGRPEDEGHRSRRRRPAPGVAGPGDPAMTTKPHSSRIGPANQS